MRSYRVGRAHEVPVEDIGEYQTSAPNPAGHPVYCRPDRDGYFVKIRGLREGP